jgi:predicted small secreted protein
MPSSHLPRVRFPRSALRLPVLRAALLSAVALLLAACGGNGSPFSGQDVQDASSAAPGLEAVSGGPVDACSILRKQDADAAFGSPMAEASRFTTPLVSGCAYESPTGYVSFEIVRWANEAIAQASVREYQSDSDFRRVTGVGDEAYWSDAYHELVVRKGTYEFVISVHGRNEANLAREVASRVLGRLP